MSRFKFKLWDQKEKVMVDVGVASFDIDGYLFKFVEKDYYDWHNDESSIDINCYLDQVSHLDCSDNYCGRGKPKHKEELRFIPLQYTGFKGICDQHIFEGDILEGLTEFGHVVWFDRGDKVGFAIKSGEDYIFDFDEPRWRVVGNIYENPEMIGDNNDKV